LSYQTPLVLSFTDYYEEVFDSADRRTLVKVISFCPIPDKYIKVIGAMHKNNIAPVKE